MIKWNEKNNYQKVNMVIDILSALMVVGFVVTTFIVWKKSPDIVPTHFNFRGEVDSYGSKSTLFLLMAILLITYILMAILSNYPNVYNYCVEINERNKEKQYNMASTFMKVMNFEVVFIFLYIQLATGFAMNDGNSKLSAGFLPIILISIFGSIGIYMWLSIKNK